MFGGENGKLRGSLLERKGKVRKRVQNGRLHREGSVSV